MRGTVICLTFLNRPAPGYQRDDSALFSSSTLTSFLPSTRKSVTSHQNELYPYGQKHTCWPITNTFASLIALLLWFNLSAQVILIASAYIVTGVEEESDRVRARYGAKTFAQRRVRRAENAVMAASGELTAARDAEAEERNKAAEKQAEDARPRADA